MIEIERERERESEREPVRVCVVFSGIKHGKTHLLEYFLVTEATCVDLHLPAAPVSIPKVW